MRAFLSHESKPRCANEDAKMPYICPHIPTEVLRPPKGVDWFNFRFRITMTSVQAGYRHLLRACNKVFGNDPAAFNTALMSIREQVASKAGVTDAEQLSE